jgi:GNAT superfamily N-acetyltransferase
MRRHFIDRGKLKLRVGTVADVRPLLDKYGEQYFHEAGFDRFSPFDIERAAREMAKQIRSGDTPFLLAELDGEVVGMVSWSLSHVFTEKPIALLWMIYVMPPNRRSAIGRLLVSFAADIAKQEGACAFFASIPPTSPAAKSLCNLFCRCGFAPMGGAFTKAL